MSVKLSPLTLLFRRPRFIMAMPMTVTMFLVSMTMSMLTLMGGVIVMFMLSMELMLMLLRMGMFWMITYFNFTLIHFLSNLSFNFMSLFIIIFWWGNSFQFLGDLHVLVDKMDIHVNFIIIKYECESVRFLNTIYNVVNIKEDNQISNIADKNIL